MPDANRVVEIQGKFVVKATTSFDYDFCSVLDTGDASGTFWTSTGMYPQEVRAVSAAIEVG
jgi:hypothetical protein